MLAGFREGSTATTAPSSPHEPSPNARKAGLLPSLGTVGDPYDNAVAEAFRGRMETELLNRRRWNTRLGLANAIFEYIEGSHNRTRRHSALEWKTPQEFKQHHQLRATVSSHAGTRKQGNIIPALRCQTVARLEAAGGGRSEPD
ncbi:integrase core domain-containing protein [Actinomadura sp. LOL_016]|uniref:integrase core domain-containing protein n=1 Tax=Actinomadura sp. LOL_016 TaxID=3345411 RepID=UPI003A867B95